MAERVLFTCVGTSDPVREMRDGSMLHIMRHYRPEKVYIFLSKEMEDFEKADRRLEKTFCFVNEKWADGTAEAVYEYSGLFNVADMDAVADPLFAFFEKMIRENPGQQGADQPQFGHAADENGACSAGREQPSRRYPRHTGGESLRQIRKERANQRGWL